jgi:hypothetical protein
MLEFAVKFHHCPELHYHLDRTPLAERYLNMLASQYLDDPHPLFRDQQKYTLDYFKNLVIQAQEILKWNWHADNYDVNITTRLHKDLEQYLVAGFENIPEDHDHLIHELHFCLHAIESGSRRDNWLQIEWYNDAGFFINGAEFPGKIDLEFGDLRLQNPFVGHHPLFLYQQQDNTNISQTCKFHNFVKPGLNLVIDNSKPKNKFNFEKYRQWFEINDPQFVQQHGWDTIEKFTGHPVIGKVLNPQDLVTTVNCPVLEFEYLKF